MLPSKTKFEEISPEKEAVKLQEGALAYQHLNGLMWVFLSSLGKVMLAFFGLNLLIYAALLVAGAAASYSLFPSLIVYGIGLLAVSQFFRVNAELARHYVETKDI